MFLLRPNIPVDKNSYVFKVFKVVRDHWKCARLYYQKAELIWNANPAPLRYKTNAIILNKPENIKYSNNFYVFQNFKDEKFYPETVTDPEKAASLGDKVVAKKVTSYQCRGVRILPSDSKELNNYCIFQKYLDVEYELRVHIVRPNLDDDVYWIPNVSKKKRTEQWSEDNLYAFTWKSLGIYPRIFRKDLWDIVHKIVMKMPLNYYSIDLLKSNGKFYLGEINVQPGFGRCLVIPIKKTMYAVLRYYYGRI